ncbi:unnamed protein product [Gordionus sp. m RMFG-2023]|uniref:DNA excision repair protein ERCC-1-like isoform X2 n=1 Tax=Gordionus sp. m RMFG-2023 TaxID=3053472 RepID=UPI0030DDE146
MNKPSTKTNSILVNIRQKGNPVLKFIRNVPWQYASIIPDYIVGETACILYLSLRYHQLNQNYIHERLKELGHLFELRVLIIQDPTHLLKEITKISILSDCTLILTWSQDEAGRYIETFKAYENKPADLIMGKDCENTISPSEDDVMGDVNITDKEIKSNQQHLNQYINCLSASKCVNKTDSQTFYKAFNGNLSKLIQTATIREGEDLEILPGIGTLKAQKLSKLFKAPFVIS